MLQIKKDPVSGISTVSEPNVVSPATDDTTFAKDGRRKHAGMFKPGVSGNPAGRPKSDATIRELARAHTEEAINTLVNVLHDKRAPVSAKVHAACALLDRGWGKPTQYIESANVMLSFSEIAAKRIAEGALERRTILDELNEEKCPD